MCERVERLEVARVMHAECSSQKQELRGRRVVFFFFQAEDGIRDVAVTGVQTCALPISATRFERTVERLRAYRQAGADCVFAPGFSSRDTIAELVKAIAAPLNILISSGCPSLAELEEMGVARVSAGSAVMRATLGLVRRIGKERSEEHTSELH